MKRKDLEQVSDDMSSPSSSKSRRLDGNLIGAMNGVPSSAFQVFGQRPLKRKELEEAFDDMSSNFSKSRRLDADFFPTMAEDKSGGIEALEQRLAQEQALACPSEMPMEPLPLSDENDKALVLYNPANTNTFYKTPASRDFSIIVNSDLIPGLRDCIFTQGSSKWAAKQVEAEQSNREESNGCLAIVPWVESTWPPSPRRETQAASQSEPMQAEEVEMMDTDDISLDGSKPSQLGAPMDGSFELQRWQQQQQHHCTQPQLLNNTNTPITWGNTYTPVTW
ncbi:PREDICTED: uncharacterized protein LOC101306694 [Fragaria vesca subsp. vesca]|uniref:uncharacterized protein LOC101306694 n=1 Tax=Fragaria vesca subsp. vesca TaxID=101020 RepID=UPI0002C31458|nr:PREDICTED: uncharacterized protein LOC101306694 [Fragaria vesca subsp. vesca]